MHAPTRRPTGPVALLLVTTALVSANPAQAEEAPGSAGLTKKGFNITDASGKNDLNIGMSLQPRFQYTLAGDPDATDADHVIEQGFRIRRALFTVNGTLAGKIDYRFRIDAARGFGFSDGAGGSQQATKPLLDDAQIIYKFAPYAELAAGQYKVPFTAENVTSDTNLLLAERALPVDGLKVGALKVGGYSYSRDVGAHLQGTVAEKKVEYQAGVFNGDGANVWPPDDGSMLLARVAVAPLGEFKYDEVDFTRGKPRLSVGGAFTQNAHPVFDTAGKADGKDKDSRYGAELRFAAAGLTVNGELLMGNYTSADDAIDPLKSRGYYAQVGYCLPMGLAPGLRYAALDPNTDSAAKDDTLTTLEAGLSYFLPDSGGKPGDNLGHKGKLQAIWTQGKLEGADDPLFNQFTLASVVGF